MHLHRILHDFPRNHEFGVEGECNTFQDRDGGDDAAGFEPGQCRLSHAGAGGDLGLGQPKRQPALADHPPDQERPASFLIPLPVVPLERRAAATRS